MNHLNPFLSTKMKMRKILGQCMVLLGICLPYSAGLPFTLSYSTYLGGSLGDHASGIAVGADGCAYVTGCTESADFPTGTCYQAQYQGGSWDAFVVKLNSSGSALQYATYLGGSASDLAQGIALDGSTNAYLVGSTSSDDFPTVQPLQGVRAGLDDVFVTVLGPTGSNLVFSTYLGGVRSDEGWSIGLDNVARVYIAGFTASTDFPLVNPYQNDYGGGMNDAFAARLRADEGVLDYATYLGGSGEERQPAIAVDGISCAYLAGYTGSSDYPTTDAYQASHAGGGWDGFLTKIVSSGSSLAYSTYFGGSQADYCLGITVDVGESPYVTGETDSIFSFPLVNPYQTYHGSRDAFLSKFNPEGSALVFSTCLGGTEHDGGKALAIDERGYVYLVGSTRSQNFPLKDPFQGSYGGDERDGIFTIFTASGDSLVYSTYLGGRFNEACNGVALGPLGTVNLCGYTKSDDFPTLGSYQSGLGGAGKNDAVLLKFNQPTPAATPTTTPSSSPSPSPSSSPTPTATPTPSGTPTMTPTPSPTPTPTTTAAPSRTPSATPTPSPTPSPSPSPSPTIYRCFKVSGVVRDKQTSQPIAEALVRVVVPFGTSPVVLSDASGAYGARVCTHIPSGYARAQARRRDYLPSYGESSYVEWTDVTGVVVELARASLLPGISEGDYDGDGTTEIALFRSPSLWIIRNLTRVYFGSERDDPSPADYDGDGTGDICVFRASTSLWAIRNLTRVYFGDFLDLPVPADYDGDGSREIAVFRNPAGFWAARNGTRIHFGLSDDQSVPGDYDGDETAEAAIFRSGSGWWAVRGVTRIYLGRSGDWTVSGDYAGEGRWAPGIFRRPGGLWAIFGVTRCYFGSGQVLPVPGDYDGDARDDIAVFNDQSGLWRIRYQPSAYFGRGGDLPVTR